MRKITTIIYLCTLLLSCKKKEIDPYLNLKISEQSHEKEHNHLQYKIKLPDTLIANKAYSATIEFESDFDTIIAPLQAGGSVLKDSTKSRLIYFYRFEPIKQSENLDENLILKDSTFVLNKSFEVNNILFPNPGQYLFCALLRDEMMYNHYNDKGIRDSIHFDRRKQQIFKKVVVVE